MCDNLSIDKEITRFIIGTNFALGLTQATIVVLVLPPSESCSKIITLSLIPLLIYIEIIYRPSTRKSALILCMGQTCFYQAPEYPEP
jgi:hypothetical protein